MYKARFSLTSQVQMKHVKQLAVYTLRTDLHSAPMITTGRSGTTGRSVNTAPAKP